MYKYLLLFNNLKLNKKKYMFVIFRNINEYIYHNKIIIYISIWIGWNFQYAILKPSYIVYEHAYECVCNKYMQNYKIEKKINNS